MALVRDPAFWKRFSAAMHLDEEAKTETGPKKPTIWTYVKAPRVTL